MFGLGDGGFHVHGNSQIVRNCEVEGVKGEVIVMDDGSTSSSTCWVSIFCVLESSGCGLIQCKVVHGFVIAFCVTE